jgi:small subunit ribosomal protein S8e
MPGPTAACAPPRPSPHARAQVAHLDLPPFSLLAHPPPPAITRDSRHKRRATGGKRHPHQKQRKYESARPGANTRIGPKRIHLVRGRGGNDKYRALRLESGTYSWASEHVAKKTRVLDVVYNASNNELVRTKTIVKSAVVLVDATPFKLWFETHYRLTLAKKTEDNQTVVKTEPHPSGKKESKAVLAKVEQRQKEYKVDPAVEAQFPTGKLLAIVSSRPGQSGRADGYILEGPELAFYQKQLQAKKSGKSAK